jgi:hypothetical protein
MKNFWESPKATLFAFLEVLSDPRRWLSPQGVGALFLVVATTWLAQRLIRRMILRWRQILPQTQIVHYRRIEFYERFATLMNSFGLQRDAAQTQLEFARQAEETLRPRLQPAGLTGGPEEISDLFYKVRFGDEPLPAIEAQRLDELLNGLETVLRPESPVAS